MYCVVLSAMLIAVGHSRSTYISTILVSVNPYKLLPIYTTCAPLLSFLFEIGTRRACTCRTTVAQYKTGHTEREPHVFAIAAEAYKRLLDERNPQAVIISGESGAGKTEATKTVLQYLSEVAGSGVRCSTQASQLLQYAAMADSGVEQEILQSNPIMEGFGNAKTLRNNNSSRFGKWMEIVRARFSLLFWTPLIAVLRQHFTATGRIGCTPHSRQRSDCLIACSPRSCENRVVSAREVACRAPGSCLGSNRH